jgi:hypothetical protein
MMTGGGWAAYRRPQLPAARDALSGPGTRWAHVASPSPGNDSLLSGVSAESASDAWAVGCRCSESGKNPPEHTLVLHWNGTSWVRS